MPTSRCIALAEPNGTPYCALRGSWETTNLLLCVGPAGNLNDHVEDGLLLVGVQRDVVEWRDRNAIFLDEDAVFKSVRSADLADGVLGGGLAVVALLGHWEGSGGGHVVVVDV